MKSCATIHKVFSNASRSSRLSIVPGSFSFVGSFPSVDLRFWWCVRVTPRAWVCINAIAFKAFLASGPYSQTKGFGIAFCRGLVILSRFSAPSLAIHSEFWFISSRSRISAFAVPKYWPHEMDLTYSRLISWLRLSGFMPVKLLWFR